MRRRINNLQGPYGYEMEDLVSCVYDVRIDVQIARCRKRVLYILLFILYIYIIYICTLYKYIL